MAGSSKAWIKVFGVALGFAMIAFGAAMLSSGSGTGPCGRFCGLQQTLIQLFGQSAHNLVFGLAWIAVGALFVMLPWLRRGVQR